MDLQKELDDLKIQVAARQQELDRQSATDPVKQLKEKLTEIENTLKAVQNDRPKTSLDLFAESHQKWVQKRDARNLA